MNNNYEITTIFVRNSFLNLIHSFCEYLQAKRMVVVKQSIISFYLIAIQVIFSVQIQRFVFVTNNN